MPALVAGFAIAILFGAVLSIVLTAAGPNGMGLSRSQTSGWIALIYGFPMIPSLVLSLRYREPLLLTGNVFALIFFASLGQRVGFPELAGATMLAGVVVLVTAVLGLTTQMGTRIPVPIVHGVIAGAVLPFVVGIFSSLNTAGGGTAVDVTMMVGSSVVAFLVGQSLQAKQRIPAILPAFLAGLFVAALTGQLGRIPPLFVPPDLQLVAPRFSWSAIATVTPVLIALMTVQSNIPSVIYLRSQGFEPPERLLNLISGGGTVLGSLFGPITVSLALPPLLLAASPSAGEKSFRYRSIYVPVAAGLLIALFAGTAADIAVLVPPVLLLTMAGLALLPALTVALREITSGPLVLGPLFAFTIALSHISLLGLGPFFWSLVLGTLVSWIFERDGWEKLRIAVRQARP